MKISIVCSQADHPVYPRLVAWSERHARDHDIELRHSVKDLTGGDVLFLISCAELVKTQTRDTYRHVLVIHASDLPEGRGWSPHVWQILEGTDEIVLSMLDAEDKVDSGAIWAKQRISIPRNAVFEEINDRMFDAEIALMDQAFDLIAASDRGAFSPEPQPPMPDARTWPKRTPADSEILPDATIAEVFDTLRIADPVRYPAFIRHRGRTYTLRLEALEENHG